MDLEIHQRLINELRSHGVSEHDANETLNCLGMTAGSMARAGAKDIVIGGGLGSLGGPYGMSAGAFIGGVKGMFSGLNQGMDSVSCVNAVNTWPPAGDTTETSWGNELDQRRFLRLAISRWT